MKEVWKILEEFPDYKVSNLGKIKIVDRVNKKLFTYKTRKGHRIYLLTKGEELSDRKLVSLHGLVADLFLPKINGLDDVKHLDFNEDNNRVDNLVRCSINDSNITYPILTDKINEVWRTIKEHPRYMVSSIGRLKDLQTKAIKSYGHDKKGYRIVNIITGKGTYKTYRLHRLLALSFLDNKDNKTIVNIIDGNPDNLVISNLEWVTPKEYNEHLLSTGLAEIGKGKHKTRYSEDKVRAICKDLEADELTYVDIAKTNNVEISFITDIVHKKSWINVSKEYVIEPHGANRKLTEDDVKNICNILRDTDKSLTEISKDYNVNSNVIHQLYVKKTWKDISKGYVFKERDVHKVITSRDVIVEIVKLFQEVPKLSDEVICERVDLSVRTIRDIRYRRTHNKITKDMIW